MAQMDTATRPLSCDWSRRWSRHVFGRVIWSPSLGHARLKREHRRRKLRYAVQTLLVPLFFIVVPSMYHLLFMIGWRDLELHLLGRTRAADVATSCAQEDELEVKGDATPEAP